MDRRVWLGFFALCLLSSTAWLVDAQWPSDIPPAPRQGLHSLVLALLFGVIAWTRAAPKNLPARPRFLLALASVLLLGVPATIAQAALSGVSEVTIAASFALLPVAVVVLVSYIGLGGGESPATNQLLAPALVGLGGTLLLLPFEFPSSSREAICEAAVLFAVLIAASASVWMHRLLRGFAVVEAVAICCLANAAFFLTVILASNLFGSAATSPGWGSLWSWKSFTVEAATSLLFDLPQLILLLWLMRDIAPQRFAARYLVIPLLTVIEGYALLRPELTLRAIAGAALVAFGAWHLIAANQHGEEPRRMLG